MNIIIHTLIPILMISSLNSCSSQSKPDVLKLNNKVPDINRATTEAIQLDDTLLYIRKMKQLANGDRSGRWPPKTVYPAAGAILPFKRVVAYYGNFYSAHMGILGEYPPGQMLEKLKAEVKAWELGDTLTPVVPAIHYIAVTAQKNPGTGNKYRLRMPFTQIDKALALAAKVNGIVFLDIQVGHSTLNEELPALKKYLQLPQVHLGIDPEFSMKNGRVPGTSIGTLDAADINYAMEYLDALVNEFKLTPKILVVHRFTGGMLTNYKQIKLLKQVQLVINMDGFGYPAKKKTTYSQVIYKEPLQFAGFKLFYKNDTKTVKQIMQPADILQLKPQPVYIQYQ
ncbi:MAG: hypothetical protein IPO42_16905 [Chitinophagaceae bacterium]|nr:hypothetical protein [Chitinophagaceae bacterium]MBK9533430.1 hypothetical protein [Chitinophagaceae bacterium]